MLSNIYSSRRVKKEIQKYGRWTYLPFVALNLALFGPALWVIYTTHDQVGPNVWVAIAG